MAEYVIKYHLDGAFPKVILQQLFPILVALFRRTV